jgi:hypothetical protein
MTFDPEDTLDTLAGKLQQEIHRIGSRRKRTKKSAPGSSTGSIF